MRRRVQGDSGLREAYTAHIRDLCASPAGRLPGCPWPETLARLEAGEPVLVAGWEVGWAGDFSTYLLHSDGRLVPVGDR